MKILHINSYFNGSSFYKNLFDKQRDTDTNIDVFVPVSKSTDTSKLQLWEYTILSKNHGKYDRFIFHLKHNKIFKDADKRCVINEYAIIHAHSLFSNGYIALRMKKKYGVPYIVAVRNTDVNTFFRYMIHLRKLGVTILKEAEKVVFLSEPYRDTVIEKYVPSHLKTEILNKTVIIPNGIDDFWIENKYSTESSFGEQNISLLYVGVINKNKNIITTVSAIENLIQRGFDVKFNVVGKILDKNIYNQIKNLPYLNYIDPKPKEELINIYRENDIFVMPSIRETFGLVYAEAMSQGLPIVYSKGQGFDGHFNDGEVGYRVDSIDPKNIADKIVSIMTNYNNISRNCMAMCGNFDWNIIVNQYDDLYKEIIENYI